VGEIDCPTLSRCVPTFVPTFFGPLDLSRAGFVIANCTDF
jgi:hypothetical protein